MSILVQPGRVERVPGSKRACVALILRQRPAQPTHHFVKSNTSCDRIPVPPDNLEVFFILRASNDRDRWSGQVGFPGGRQEGNETDCETAAREVREEVGLVLPSTSGGSSTAFTHLGRVDDRVIFRYSPSSRTMIVSCLVYLQTTPTTPRLLLAPHEVAACTWVPVQYFLSNRCASGLSFNISAERAQFRAHHPVLSRLAFAMGLNETFFTKVQMPIGNGSGSEDGSRKHCSSLQLSVPKEQAQDRRDVLPPWSNPDPATLQSAKAAFFLWGLSLSILNDFLVKNTQWRTHRIQLVDSVNLRIPVVDRPITSVEVEKVFASTAHNLALVALRSTVRATTGHEMNWSECVGS